jgi:hypothetical protein
VQQGQRLTAAEVVTAPGPGVSPATLAAIVQVRIGFLGVQLESRDSTRLRARRRYEWQMTFLQVKTVGLGTRHLDARD